MSDLPAMNMFTDFSPQLCSLVFFTKFDIEQVAGMICPNRKVEPPVRQAFSFGIRHIFIVIHLTFSRSLFNNTGNMTLSVVYPVVYITVVYLLHS